MELLAQILSWLISTVFWLAGLLSLVGIGFVAYLILSGPFRRIDCANLVVQLNELAAASGQTRRSFFSNSAPAKSAACLMRESSHTSTG